MRTGLLDDLSLVQWPASTLEMQKNWIGRSIGAEVEFGLAGINGTIRIFTTRPDTLFGATYMVLAPEHPLVEAVTAPMHSGRLSRPIVRRPREKATLQRQELEKEKTGVFTGGYAVNPVNDERLPIWIADYVLMGYGTGAIMAVPAHDARDWAFAKTYSLPIREVIAGGDVEKEAFVETEQGTVDQFHTPDGRFSIDGLAPVDAIPKITAWLETIGKGRKSVNYKLRDWLFARQRYWGEPFPIVWVDGEARPLPEEQLPLALPETTISHRRVTARVRWQTWSIGSKPQIPATGKPARRETNTMPQWAGSCWYYLRFIDPKNDRPAGRSFEGTVLDAGRSLYRRQRACRPAPPVFPILAQGAVRHRRRLPHRSRSRSSSIRASFLGEDNQKMSKSRGQRRESRTR